MSDSFIGVSNGAATSFVGPDAVSLYRATVVKQGIALHQKCGMILTRGATITKLFAIATEYTGKRYKRGEHSRAIADLQIWIDTMKAALPVVAN